MAKLVAQGNQCYACNSESFVYCHSDRGFVVLERMLAVKAPDPGMLWIRNFWSVASTLCIKLRREDLLNCVSQCLLHSNMKMTARDRTVSPYFSARIHSLTLFGTYIWFVRYGLRSAARNFLRADGSIQQISCHQKIIILVSIFRCFVAMPSDSILYPTAVVRTTLKKASLVEKYTVGA